MFGQNPDERTNYEQNPANYNSYYENNPQVNPSGTSHYVNYYSDPAETPKKSGGAGGAILKVVAGLAALAVVSVSSIELYKIFGSKENTLTSVEEREEETSDKSREEKQEAEEENEEEKSDDDAADKEAEPSVSWINMATPEDALTIPEIVEKAMPSVVGVSAVFEGTSNDYYYYYYFNGQQTQQYTGTGTGIVMSSDGYIITNAHCIYDSSEYEYGEAVSVSVLMADESEYEAEIIGYDLETDLAVLKVDATGLTAAEFGDSNDLQVGEMVVAIGNPLGFELFGTTTCGIVSALNREVTINEKNMTLIQTDAAINSGNSGGPLLNCYGQVIGINSAKMSSTYSSASVEGLGFAIPIADASEIIDDLINYGYVVGRPQLGITSMDIDESTALRFNLPQGVYVYAVTEDSAAEKAGLQLGDVIIAVEGVEVHSIDELNAVKNEYEAGDTIELTIFRAGEEETIELTLEEAGKPQ